MGILAFIVKKHVRIVQGSDGLSNVQPNSIGPMTLGELFLEAMSTGVITNGEMAWVTAHQDGFDRTEEAVALRLGRRGLVLRQDVGADAGALGRGLRVRQERARGRRWQIRVPHGRVVRRRRVADPFELVEGGRRGRHGGAVRATQLLEPPLGAQFAGRLR